MAVLTQKCNICGKPTENIFFCDECKHTGYELVKDAYSEVKSMYESVSDEDALELLNEGFDLLVAEVTGEFR